MKALRLVGVLLVAGGCRDMPPPPALTTPLPLERVATASDLRVDSRGRLLGSLIGEGTAGGIHALSNDTAVALALLARTGLFADPMGHLRSGATVHLNAGRAPVAVEEVVVATPLGYTRGQLRGVHLRADTCGSRPIVELIVESATAPGGGPPLLGPVLVSLRTGDTGSFAPAEFGTRSPATLTDSTTAALRGAAERLLDSVLAARLPSHWLPLAPPRPPAVQVNVLGDIDGVDIVAFHPATGRGYAVTVRERRVAANGDTLLATGSYTWRGGRLRPLIEASAFRLSRGTLAPVDPALPPGYARRLSALAGFGSSVDHLWFEFVDAAAGSTTWIVIAPESHTVTAAVTVAGRCPP